MTRAFNFLEEAHAIPNPSDEDVITPVFDDHHLHAERPLITEPEQSRDTSNKIAKKQQTANPAKEKSPLPLRYRKRSLWLLGCYLPFLIVPWVLTCVMAIRPLSLPSYYNQKGEYGSNLYLVMLFWLGFVRVLNSISSLITVPVVSALLAQGAVVFSQRRKPKQALNLRQTFALADRGWNDIPTLWLASRGNGKGSKYLWLATGLLFLSAIQAPVQQALVSTETITIMTCQDQPVWETSAYCDPGRLPVTLAFDPEPYYLALTPQNMVVREVIKKLATVNEMDVQQHLWHEPSTNVGDVDLDEKASSNTFFWFYDVSSSVSTYFVSALVNDTTTGILREHAIRLNSTVDCEPILEDVFPSSCGGKNPFVTSIDRPGSLSIDICLPGDYTATAWNLTRDRQDIQEQLYIKVHIPYNSSLAFGQVELFENFTVQCSANSTRGYFELGNGRNNFAASGIMEKWPDQDTLWNEYNDYLGPLAGYIVPSAINTYENDSLVDWITGIDPFETSYHVTPGPLMTSALAMFGNESFFYVARNSSSSSFPGPVAQICQAGNIPFTRLTLFADIEYEGVYGACDDINSPYAEEYMADDDRIGTMLYQWFSIFNLTGTKDSQGYAYSGNYAKKALEVAMFFANEAWLTQTAATTQPFSARSIYTSPGMPMFRPAKTLAGTIIVSVLIFLQIIGLSVLAWYIYTVPTWTPMLDSMAVSQLAKSVDNDKIPPIGYSNDEEIAKLKDVDGLVGIANEDELLAQTGNMTSERVFAERLEPEADLEASQVEDNSAQDIVASMSTAIPLGPLKLARGGPGLITKQHAPPRKRKWRKERQSKEALLEKGDMHREVIL